MQKLDRLPWRAGFEFTAFGARVGVRVNDPTILSEVLPLLPPHASIEDSSDSPIDELISVHAGKANRRGIKPFHLVYGNVEQFARTPRWEEALHFCETLFQLTVALYSREYVFIHAGVVEWAGKAILLPGRSFSGKSTLVAALLRAGANYLSDEYAVLDRFGQVHSFPRRLAIRQQAGQGRIRYEAADLGAAIVETPIPVGLVAVTQYRPNAVWTPRPVSAPQRPLVLLRNAVAARRSPETCLTHIGNALQGAQVIQSVRGEAEKAAQLLIQACET